MTKKSNQIVFFGSGPVAVASLSNISNVFDVEAVITKTSTKTEMQDALDKSISSVYVADSKNELNKLISSKNFVSKVGVLVDFGIIVSSKVIESFPLGIINSHFSLLPQWRGADPISFSILSGQKETGVSLMILNEELDEGPIVSQEKMPIGKQETTPSLTNKLVSLSSEMLTNDLPRYINHEIRPKPQDLTKPVTYSRKLSKSDGKIDWTKPASEIEKEIRAYYDWPRSYTNLSGIDLIIRNAKLSSLVGKPGSFRATKSDLTIYCGENSLQIQRLQPAGKKEMETKAFLAGYGSRIKQA